MIGLYVHIPFCAKKCDYCDFYSLTDMSKAQEYVSALCREMGKYDFVADTLYIGGGTPSQLSAENLCRIIDSAPLCDNAEITVEMNPGDKIAELILPLKEAGVNRVSLGVQSVNDTSLKKLGRRHSFADVKEAIEVIKQSGINNISLDFMLATEGQTTADIDEAVAFAKAQNIPHISAYILKVEEGTPLYLKQDKIILPSEDEQAFIYEYFCRQMKKAGYNHYEISNFCKEGYESRHNLKYWRCEEYLGFGPSAHSYFEGKRFFYPRDLNAFIKGNTPISDGNGGEKNEVIMLALRLKEGLNLNDRRVADVKEKLLSRAKQLSPYVVLEGDTLRLSEKGFLLSNAVISRLID